MKLLKRVFSTVVLMLLCLSVKGFAQGSSINTYSPYTFYGIGDINTQGSALIRSMGGASMGLRSAYIINYLNPASYSAMGPNSFLFNVGMEGQNFYEKNATTNTSFNTFNIRNIALAFPITRKLGFGFSMTPYSSVGYSVRTEDKSDDVLTNIGLVSYLYEGSGGVTQFKAGLGYNVFKNISIGADLVYYHGNISRDFTAYFTPITSGGSFSSVYGEDKERIAKFFATLGIQANLISTQKTMLTLGATYNMGGKMNADVTRYVPSNNLSGDTVSYSNFTSNFALASTYSIGAYLHKQRYSLGVDYEFSDWGRRNDDDRTESLSFRNTNAVKIGAQFTPNPGDVRNFLKRWTYRAGVRYSDYYMVINGQKMNDKAITLGVGVPIRMVGLSNINFGFELGQRGTTNNGLVKENYFKFSIGLALFGEDSWFVKFKYD